MNPVLSHKIIVARVHHDFRRLLSTQRRNINITISSAHRKPQNLSSTFPLFPHSSLKLLHNAPAPLYASFHRSISEAAKLDEHQQLGNLAKVQQADDPLAVLVDPLKLQNEKMYRLSETVPESPIETIQDKANEVVYNMIDPLQEYSESMVVQLAKQALIQIHEITGLPWWASIALTALMVRTIIVLPFAINQASMVGKLQMVSLKMVSVTKKLQADVTQARSKFGWPEEITEERYNEALKKEYDNRIITENCHPSKTFILMMVQVPTWIIFSLATNDLCFIPSQLDVSAQAVCTQLSTGGFGWITDLTAVDSMMLLPVTVATINYITIEIHQAFKVNPHSGQEHVRSMFFQIISLLLIPVGAALPAAVNIYWVSSSLWGLVQAILLNNKIAYRLLNVPVKGTPMENPGQLFKTNIKSKLRLQKDRNKIDA